MSNINVLARWNPAGGQDPRDDSACGAVIRPLDKLGSARLSRTSYRPTLVNTK